MIVHLKLLKTLPPPVVQHFSLTGWQPTEPADRDDFVDKVMESFGIDYSGNSTKAPTLEEVEKGVCEAARSVNHTVAALRRWQDRHSCSPQVSPLLEEAKEELNMAQGPERKEKLNAYRTLRRSCFSAAHSRKLRSIKAAAPPKPGPTIMIVDGEPTGDRHLWTEGADRFIGKMFFDPMNDFEQQRARLETYEQISF